MIANDMTSISNVVKVYHLFQKINSGGGGQKHVEKLVLSSAYFP